MASLNKVIIMGNLTADPELKQTQGGQSVTSFTVAVNRKYKKDGGNECDFINVVAWRERAEFVTKYFNKGANIIVCGSIQTRSYTTNTGEKRTATEVVADEVAFGAFKADSTAKGTNDTPDYVPAGYGGNSAAFEELDTGEGGLPF